MNKSILICSVFLYSVLAGVSMAGNLTDNGNGTVTDSGTRLMWQQEDNSVMTWEAALTYCEGLVLPASGYTDWRLPNHKELLSLVDETRVLPSINIARFPREFYYTSPYFWSSTTYAEDAVTHGSYAWYVDFYWGGKSLNNAAFEEGEVVSLGCNRQAAIRNPQSNK